MKKRSRSGNENKLGYIAKASFSKGGGRRSLTEDCIDVDGSKGDKSSVSCADSSFAKGAFGVYGERKSVAGILLKFRASITFFPCWYCFNQPFFRLYLDKTPRDIQFAT